MKERVLPINLPPSYRAIAALTQPDLTKRGSRGWWDVAKRLIPEDKTIQVEAESYLRGEFNKLLSGEDLSDAWSVVVIFDSLVRTGSNVPQELLDQALPVESSQFEQLDRFKEMILVQKVSSLSEMELEEILNSARDADTGDVAAAAARRLLSEFPQNLLSQELLAINDLAEIQTWGLEIVDLILAYQVSAGDLHLWKICASAEDDRALLARAAVYPLEELGLQVDSQAIENIQKTLLEQGADLTNEHFFRLLTLIPIEQPLESTLSQQALTRVNMYVEEIRNIVAQADLQLDRFSYLGKFLERLYKEDASTCKELFAKILEILPQVSVSATKFRFKNFAVRLIGAFYPIGLPNELRAHYPIGATDFKDVVRSGLRAMFWRHVAHQPENADALFQSLLTGKLDHLSIINDVDDLFLQLHIFVPYVEQKIIRSIPGYRNLLSTLVKRGVVSPTLTKEIASVDVRPFAEYPGEREGLGEGQFVDFSDQCMLLGLTEAEVSQLEGQYQRLVLGFMAERNINDSIMREPRVQRYLATGMSMYGYHFGAFAVSLSMSRAPISMVRDMLRLGSTLCCTKGGIQKFDFIYSQCFHKELAFPIAASFMEEMLRVSDSAAATASDG